MISVSNITQYVSTVRDRQGQVDAVYTDGILLRKLKSFRFCTALLLLLESFLENRQFYVSYNGYTSSYYAVAESDVSQGSNLKPLLFLLFINELPAFFTTKCLTYADDVKFYSYVTSLNDCCELQRNIDFCPHGIREID